MPKRTDINSIMILTSGPIVIGQACEFDYSGLQACQAFKEQGMYISLVGPNPASILTDPMIADKTYTEPLDADVIEKILEKEKPDALLPTMGGQIALNLTMELEKRGALKDIEILGVTMDSVRMAEDRSLFRDAMSEIGLEMPKSFIINSLEEGEKLLDQMDLPLIIRPSFTLGGGGGGIAYNREEYRDILSRGLDMSPINQVLIDESILGWKEYEMEIIRDSKDNCIIVCSIENLDPMGVHTGDSITVAPSLTLTDKEYQRMRNASIDVMRKIGMNGGGSNVQFAVDPKTGRMCVIEMNPRVSRSSALASKATGFPIARVSALLSIGYTVDELQNSMLPNMPASFEPTLDYVVTKLPRFAFEKFPDTTNGLGTSMRSVGEVMAIGGSFLESLQKAYYGLEAGLAGLDEVEFDNDKSEDEILNDLGRPTPDRLRKVAQAMRMDISVDKLNETTGIDIWFLDQIKVLIEEEKKLKDNGMPNSPLGWRRIKSMGFCDERIAHLCQVSVDTVRNTRHGHKVFPIAKKIDSCAGEFDTPTPYFYLTYPLSDFSKSEGDISKKEKVIILGSGPNRIGQGLEFDYCCVHSVLALSQKGYETIMINCNPETVSTDYDAPKIGMRYQNPSDKKEDFQFKHKLYFESVSSETLLEVMRLEGQDIRGIVVQMGGQTPLKVIKHLSDMDLPILGTSKDSLDLTEDRERFSKLLSNLGIKQPSNGVATSKKEAIDIVSKINFPVLLRPSYVIGGRSMKVVWEENALDAALSKSFKVSEDSPLLIDSYLQDAIEADLDCISDGENVFVAGIMEHIEEAGIHSGDSSCVIPTRSLDENTISVMKSHACKIAKALNVKGWLNIQFAITNKEVYVLEANPRASRTVPFLSKVLGVPLNRYACNIMLGDSLKDQDIKEANLDYISVKASVFPFRYFSGSDIILGPEMLSTGEVMSISKDFGDAFGKAQLSAGTRLPRKGSAFISVKAEDKGSVLEIARELSKLGFEIFATKGTCDFLQSGHVPATKVNKVLQGRPHIVDMIKDGKIDIVINTTLGAQSIKDSYTIRSSALRKNIPCYTSMRAAEAALESIKFACSGKENTKQYLSLQEYHDKN